MNVGWKKTTLGAAFVTVTGNTPPKNNPELFGRFIPLVKPPELCDAALDSAEDGLSEAGARVARTAPPKSILVSCIGNLGKIGLNTIPVAFNQQINAILPDEKRVVPEFMFYQVLSCRFKEQLEGLSSGTTVPIVNKSRFNGIEVVLPPFPEQQRIVAILDEAFEAIATAKANAEKNLQNARALFESHLKTALAGQAAGWVEKTLAETCILRSGTTLPKDLEKPSGEVPYLKVADMNLPENRDGITSSSRYVNARDVNASNLLPVGTTIFPKRGGAILTNKKRLTQRVICADLNIMGVTPKDELLPEFLFNYFLRLDLREINNGSSIPQINNYSIEPLNIAYPKSLQAQKVIVDKLDALRQETQCLATLYQRKLAALKALKKSLLHQAFSGELSG